MAESDRARQAIILHHYLAFSWKFRTSYDEKFLVQES